MWLLYDLFQRPRARWIFPFDAQRKEEVVAFGNIIRFLEVSGDGSDGTVLPKS